MHHIQTMIVTVLGFVACLRVGLWYRVTRPSHLAYADGNKNRGVTNHVRRFNQDAHRRDFVAMRKQRVEKIQNSDTFETASTYPEMPGDERLRGSGINASGKDHVSISRNYSV